MNAAQADLFMCFLFSFFSSQQQFVEFESRGGELNNKVFYQHVPRLVWIISSRSNRIRSDQIRIDGLKKGAAAAEVSDDENYKLWL